MKRLTKATAVALAMTMAVPTVAFASSATPTEPKGMSGSFDTSFDVYSPKLTVSVPVKLDVEVNPLGAASTDKSVKQFTVASNSMDIVNGSVDIEADTAIPVVATVKATIDSKGEEVVSAYNSFTADDTSAKKKIYLNLATATKAPTLDITAGAFDSEKHLDLSKYEIDDAAEYAPSTTNSITKYGSLLSINIAGPTTTDTTTDATFSSDATKVTPGVASFAVTGVANTNANWKADDLKVDVTYDIKASKPINFATPTVAAVTHTSGTSATDLTITVPNVGEATVIAMAVHNDDAYGDQIWPEGGFEVEYAPNATTITQTDATITLSKTDAGLAFLAGDDYKGKAQDLVIGLSDGRIIVTTLTVN